MKFRVHSGQVCSLKQAFSQTHDISREQCDAHAHEEPSSYAGPIATSRGQQRNRGHKDQARCCQNLSNQHIHPPGCRSTQKTNYFIYWVDRVGAEMRLWPTRRTLPTTCRRRPCLRPRKTRQKGKRRNKQR